MFSQSNEEVVILKYFEGQTGTFASVGENDGVTFSNVRALALLNWNGICVEPDKQAFERLQNLYKGFKNVKCYNYAICNFNGKRMLQHSGALINGKDTGLVSTFHASEMSRFSKVLDYTPEEVKCFTWKTALNRWKIKKFDFISADTEGCEMEFLPDIDLSETKMICLEHNGNIERKNQYLECTSKYGLNRIIYESGENILVVR